MSNVNQNEIRPLYASMVGALFLAAWGLVMAKVASSQAITLDAMFNLISAVMTFVSIWVTHVVSQKHTKNYPLGFFAYETLFVICKGMSILVLIFIAVSGAVEKIAAGGEELEAGYLVLYVVVAVPVCGLLFWVTRRGYKATGSAILLAESQAWLINMLISGSLGLAFLGVMVLEDGPYDWLTRDIDSLLVILMCLMSIRDPWLLFRNGIRELTLMRPGNDYEKPVIIAIDVYRESHKVDIVDVEVMKMGRMCFVTITVDPDEDMIRMHDFLDLRQALRETVAEIYSESITELLIDRRVDAEA